jgi:uncharacterized protein YqeY
MRLRDKVNDDLMAAMKARDAARVSTLRMMKTAIKNREIDLRAQLEDPQALEVLKTLIKQRKDSIEQFLKGKRGDLASKEAAEIKIIEEYLPAAVGEEEIEKVVAEVIQTLSAVSLKEMGPVMKQCMARFSGKLVDGKKVSDVVKRRLEKSS